MRVKGFEELFKVTRYPAGESHVEAIKPFEEGDVIQCSHVRNFEDLGNILTASSIAEHLGRSNLMWFIPYFPFGRHDRRRSQTDGLTLKVAMQLVENLNVVTVDPHSDVLGQIRHIPQWEVVRLWMKRLDLFEAVDTVVIPDDGATKKASEWLRRGYGFGRTVLQAHKVRDTSTGELSGFYVEGDATGHCLIVDDICDGGGTFLGLAKELRMAGAKELTLAVTHGLFTKGTVELFKKFNRIFSTGPYILRDSGIKRIPHHTIFEEATFV